jgi:hypothetical protein
MRFEGLREILLKGGVAPRYVRRYLAELSEHLDDLIEKQQAQGYEGEDATLRARALLGEDRELAAAMLERKSLRSVTARAPWLIFGLLPPVAGIAAAFALIAPLALIARILHMVAKGGILAPQWFQGIAFAVTGAGNLALAPALAAGFALLAGAAADFLALAAACHCPAGADGPAIPGPFPRGRTARRLAHHRRSHMDLALAELARDMALVAGAVVADFAARLLVLPEKNDRQLT